MSLSCRVGVKRERRDTTPSLAEYIAAKYGKPTKGAFGAQDAALAPPPAMTMRHALSDAALLATCWRTPVWQAWRVLLVAAMGEALDEEEREVFKRLTGRPVEPGERLEKLWAVVGRRDGKSRDSRL